MKIKLTATKIQPNGLTYIFNDMWRRTIGVGTVVGRALAEATAEEVKRRIPSGGWTSVYRDMIEYLESPGGAHWAVAGLAKIELSKVPAKESLIWFTGKGLGAQMAPYNPWPLLSIPAIRGDYKDDVVIRPAGESAVEAREAELSAISANIVIMLRDEGYEIDPDGAFFTGGQAYFDMAYAARSLELGLDGRRIPHWGPAASNVGKANWVKAKTVTTTITKEVDDILTGGEPQDYPTMSRAKAQELARIREETWS